MPGTISRFLTMMNRTKSKRTKFANNRGYSSSSSNDSSFCSDSDSSSDDSRPEEEEEDLFGKKTSSYFGTSKKKTSKKSTNPKKVPQRTCTVQCSSKLGSKHMYNEDTYLATFDIAAATKRTDAKNSTLIHTSAHCPHTYTHIYTLPSL